ncbi:MAG: caspase family protein [Polyangiales bacterium]
MYLHVHTGGDAVWRAASVYPDAPSFDVLDEGFSSGRAPAVCARGGDVLVVATGVDEGVWAAALGAVAKGVFARVGGDALAGAAPALASLDGAWVCALRGTDGLVYAARDADPDAWCFAAVSSLETPVAPSLCGFEGAAWIAAVDASGTLHLGPLDGDGCAFEPVGGAPASRRAPSLCVSAGALHVAVVDDEGAVWLGRVGVGGVPFRRLDAPTAEAVCVADFGGRLAVSVTAADDGRLALALDDAGAFRFEALGHTQAAGAAAMTWAPAFAYDDPEAEAGADWGDPVVTDEGVSAPTIHAVLVGYGAGIGVPGDIAMHRDFLARVQAAGVARVREYTALAREATPDGVRAALDAVEAAEADVVWVVFSGHGGSAEGDYYWVTRGRMLRRAEVVERVREKAARLRVVLSDCCSSEMGRVTPPRRKGEARPDEDDRVDAWRALLLEHEGMVDLTSSSEYQYSFAGVFTPALVRDTLMRDTPRSWHVVFERVRRLCQRCEGALPEALARRFERVGARVEAGQTPWAFALPAPMG